MNPSDVATMTPEEKAITLYQEIMGVDRHIAEHAYMLAVASLASARKQGIQSFQYAYDQSWESVLIKGIPGPTVEVPMGEHSADTFQRK